MVAEELRTVQKEEAVKRMKALKMLDQPIKEFEEEDKLNLSESHGILYWLDEEEQKMVDRFEKEHNGLVYHVIKSFTTIGLMYSLLYVSEYLEEWKMDMENIDDECQLAYVVNKDIPDCSEFGTIGIKPMNGGVVRTW